MTDSKDAARAVVLSLLMLVSMVGVGFTGAGGTVEAASGNVESLDDLEGSGTEDDPYNITNASGLQVMKEDLSAHYRLVEDIDASNTSEWNDGAGFEPIGSFSERFTGSFNGTNRTIQGLVIDRSTRSNVGLFGYVEGGTVEQTRLSGVEVTGEFTVGGAVGNNNGTVREVAVTGNVTGNGTVGGLVGNNAGTVDTTISKATVKTNGTAVGGLVGDNDGVIVESRADAVVTGTDDVGGFVGQNTGELKRVTSESTVGGDERIGGLVGDNQGQIRYSYAGGEVDGGEYIGGLAGSHQSGVNDASIVSTYSTTAVNGSNDVGGLVGFIDNDPVVNRSYWDENTSGLAISAAAGNGSTALITAEMTGEAVADNMTDFDFDTVWRTTESYPELRATEIASVSGSLTATRNASLAGDFVGAFYELDDEIDGAEGEIEADGSFQIDGLEEGQTHNLVYADSDAGDELNGVPDLYAIDTVTPPEDGIGAELPEAHNVTVRVVDDDGEPIENADVAISHTNGSATIEEGDQNVTNENGYLTDDDESPLELAGEITVSAEYRGVNNSTTVTVDDGPENVTVKLSRPEVTGTLTADSDDSLENDSVFLYRETADGDIEEYNTTVDADGNFSVAGGFAEETYTLVFVDQNDSDSPNDVPDVYAIDRVTAPEDVNAELPEAHNVTIRVTDEEDTPVENASIVLAHRNGDAGFVDEGENVTNEDGLVSRDGATQLEFYGDIFVGAQTPSGDTAVERVNVTSDTDINLTATPEPRVHGDLTAESGAPLEGSELALVRTADGEIEEVHNATVDENGSFEILSAEEGRTYDLVFIDNSTNASSNSVPDRYAIGEVTPPFALGTVELPQAYNVTFEITDRDENSIENASVAIRHTNNGAVIRDGVLDATNENGVLSIDGRTQFEVVGDITVVAERRGIRNDTSEIVDETGPETIGVELPLTAEVSGRLELPNGSNATSDIVAFRGIETADYNGTVTDETGSFTTTVPNQAGYDVLYAQSESASSDPTYPLDGVPDLYPIDREYVSGDTDVGNRTLPEGHRLNVTVETADGEPLPNTTVEIENRNLANGAVRYADFETTEDGHIAPGGTPGVELAEFVEIELESDEYVAEERFVELSEEGDTSVTLVAQKPIDVTGNVTNAAGDPVTGWEVVGDPESEGGLHDDARLDRNGSYTLTLQQNAEYGIGFRQIDEADDTVYPKDGVPDIAAVRPVDTGTNDTDVGTSQLGVGHPYNVTVTNASGEPLEDVRVDVVSVGPEGNVAVGAPGSTDANGRVVLDGARTPGFEANGTVEVYVDAPDGSGLADTSESYEIDAADSDTIVLEPALQVTGTVFEPDGETPAESERISVRSQGDGTDEDVFTDDSGAFEASVPEEGTYSVGFTQVAGDGQYEPTFPQDGVPDVYALANVSSPGGADLETRTLPQAHNLTVEVVGPDGESVTDAKVNVGSVANDATHYAQGAVDDAGNFTVEVNGTVDVYVEPGSDALQPDGTGRFEVTDDEPVTVTLDEADDGTDGGDDGTDAGGGGGGDGGSEADPQVNVTQSSVTPTNATTNGTEEYTVTVTVENTSLTDESGEVDVRFEEFDLDVDDDPADGPEEDLRIDYTGENITDGTITVSTTVSGTAPTASGQYPVNVTDVEVENETDGTDDFLIEDANTEITTITVEADDGTGDDTTDGGTGDDTTDDSTPGFGPLVTLVALLGAAALLGRRREGH